MAWYYVHGNNRLGPYDDAQWQQLLASGIVNPATLVWREGMAQWAPLGQLAGGGVATAEGSAVCSRCGAAVAGGEFLDFGGRPVCAACKPIYLQQLREGVQPLGAAGVRYAGFWIRFVAAFIDGLVLMVPGTAVGMITVPLMMQFDNPIAMMLFANPVATLIGYAISLLYDGLMVGRYGATLGKMALGLRVVTPDGQTVTYGRAFGRAAAEIITGWTFTIGYIIAGFDSQKRALHDHIAGTRVIYK